jgi:pimeloyl-ACP methyl ester carboxylesterase
MYLLLERPPEMNVKTAQAGDLTIGYREVGAGPPVLLLHGWPTSSFLWRRVMPGLAAGGRRVIAPDLPGFGASDKPADVRYGFELYERAIDGLLDALRVDTCALVVHDLGGPVGVHWMLGRPGRVTRLGLLNTLLYPEFDPSVAEFVTALSTPGRRERLTSAEGLTEVLRLGLADPASLTVEALAGHLAPFRTDADRLALAKAGIELGLDGFADLAAGMPSLELPVAAIYGGRDKILPDVARTMARVGRDVPHATVTELPDCGHFLQEEAPQEVARLLAGFLAEDERAAA